MKAASHKLVYIFRIWRLPVLGCTDLRLKPVPDLERGHVTENVMRKAFVSPSAYGKLCIYVVWGALD